MKTSIIIPAYNEEKTIKKVIDKIKNLKIDKEIIVIDDGSKDGTLNMIKNIEGIKIFKHDKNLGKGAAVKTGIKNAIGDIILIQDADLELDPSQIPSLIRPILTGKARVVYGSRNINNVRGDRSPLFYFGGKIITLVTNFLYNTNITDEPCGYKVFMKDVLRNLKIKGDRFDFEPEITAKIARKGIKIYEVPVISTARSTYQGKKLKRRDGIIAFFILIKYRFVN